MLQERLITVVSNKTYQEDAKNRITAYFSNSGQPSEVVAALFRNPNEISEAERKKIRQHVSVRNTSILLRMLTRYAVADTNERKFMLRSDSGLGLIMFSLACGLPAKHELELDCRGSIQMYCYNYYQTVGTTSHILLVIKREQAI